MGVKMKKGITPIISIIVLLVITIALAGLAWSFLQGYLVSQISSTFTITSGAAYCSNGVITVQVLNTGQSTLTQADFTITKVDGTDVTPRTVTIQPGKAATIISYDCGGTCSTGSHTVDIGTSSTVQHPKVYCT